MHLCGCMRKGLSIVKCYSFRRSCKHFSMNTVFYIRKNATSFACKQSNLCILYDGSDSDKQIINWRFWDFLGIVWRLFEDEKCKILPVQSPSPKTAYIKNTQCLTTYLFLVKRKWKNMSIVTKSCINRVNKTVGIIITFKNILQKKLLGLDSLLHPDILYTHTHDGPLKAARGRADCLNLVAWVH